MSDLKRFQENPNYRGLTTGEKYEKASMDERYAAHCDLVKTRVELDFSIYKSGVLRNKCNGFFKKVEFLLRTNHKALRLQLDLLVSFVLPNTILSLHQILKCL